MQGGRWALDGEERAPAPYRPRCSAVRRAPGAGTLDAGLLQRAEQRMNKARRAGQSPSQAKKADFLIDGDVHEDTARLLRENDFSGIHLNKKDEPDSFSACANTRMIDHAHIITPAIRHSQVKVNRCEEYTM